jgi:hypothetical protein
MLDSIVTFVILITLLGLILAAVIGGGIWIVRAFVRRMAGAGGRSIALGVATAFATALLTFILVYVSAWAEIRQQVAMGDISPARFWMMRNDFVQIRQALADYAGKHGHFPDSLKEIPDLEQSLFQDAWRHPYQYTKTEGGYSLISLGRDGRPGGVGLDADIVSDQDHDAQLDIEPTLAQFLFEAKGRRTLFTTALLASCCAGLACYIASGSRAGRPASVIAVLPSVAVTTVGAVFVSLFLVTIYLIGDHH